MTHQEYLKQVIKVRKKLINMKISKKNAMICLKIIKRLELQISTYSKKWNSKGWSKFLERNYSDIVFLIPGNKSKQHQIEILNSLLL